MDAPTRLTPEQRDALFDLCPADAGEYADDLMAILLRIDPAYGRVLQIGAGWYPIIIELNDALAAIDPSYQIHQVKEKFGGLRYYVRLSSQLPDEQSERAHSLIRQAESRSFATCEICSAPGTVNSDYWRETRCADHATPTQETPVPHD